MTDMEQERLQQTAEDLVNSEDSQVPVEILPIVRKLRQAAQAEQTARRDVERHSGAVHWLFSLVLEYVQSQGPNQSLMDLQQKAS